MKTVLITGATHGIGYQLAKIFHNKGYSLLLFGRDDSRIASLKKEFTGSHVYKLDLSSDDSAESVVALLKKDMLSVDILVNNAGFGLHGRFMDNDMVTETDMMHLNMITLVKLTKLIGKDMKKGSMIMNVASVAGFFPGPFMSIYFATKSFVVSFSLALAEELKDKGISVTTLCPGPTLTEFEKRSGAKFFGHVMSAEQVAKIGYDGMMQRRRLVVPGLMNSLFVAFSGILPKTWIAKFIYRIQKKKDCNS